MPHDFVEAMSVVIPRLLAYLDFSHYELLSQLSLYGTVYVTGKLQLTSTNYEVSQKNAFFHFSLKNFKVDKCFTFDGHYSIKDTLEPLNSGFFRQG